MPWNPAKNTSMAKGGLPKVKQAMKPPGIRGPVGPRIAAPPALAAPAVPPMATAAPMGAPGMAPRPQINPQVLAQALMNGRRAP